MCHICCSLSAGGNNTEVDRSLPGSLTAAAVLTAYLPNSPHWVHFLKKKLTSLILQTQRINDHLERVCLINVNNVILQVQIHFLSNKAAVLHANKDE